MNLPYAGCKLGNMFYCITCRNPLIRIFFFLREVIVQCVINAIVGSIYYGITIKHPLTLSYIVGSVFTGMIKHTIEQSPVN